MAKALAVTSNVMSLDPDRTSILATTATVLIATDPVLSITLVTWGVSPIVTYAFGAVPTTYDVLPPKPVTSSPTEFTTFSTLIAATEVSTASSETNTSKQGTNPHPINLAGIIGGAVASFFIILILSALALRRKYNKHRFTLGNIQAEIYGNRRVERVDPFLTDMENNLPEDSRVVREQQIDGNRRIQKVDLLPIEMEGSASENSKVAKERRSDIRTEPKLPPSQLAEIMPTPDAAHSLESQVRVSGKLVMQTRLDRRMVASNSPLDSSPTENGRRNSLELASLVGNSENTSRAKLETALVAGSIPEYPPPPYPGS